MLPMVLEAVRAEGVGVDDLRAGFDIGAVDRGDVVRTFDVPVLGRLPRPKSPLLQKRPHSTVEENGCMWKV